MYDRTMCIFGELVNLCCEVRELDGVQFLVNPGTSIGRLVDASVSEISHPFHLEVEVGNAPMYPIYVYPVERSQIRELARKISSAFSCQVTVTAAARHLIRYENGFTRKELNIHDFYYMTEEEAESYNI